MRNSLLTELAPGLQAVDTRAQALGIRLVLHPDQFVVLSSDRPDVIQNSIKILATHARIMDLLGLPQSAWAAMNIHGGKGDRAERLVGVIRELPDTIRHRLTLENDEYTYSGEEILWVCQAAGIPLVFDAHHQSCPVPTVMSPGLKSKQRKRNWRSTSCGRNG
jgi:UV DNA damage endonuclease